MKKKNTFKTAYIRNQIINVPQMMFVDSHKHGHLICHGTDAAGFMLCDSIFVSHIEPNLG